MTFTDEEQPLLRIISRELENNLDYDLDRHGKAFDFDPEDPEDPRNWPRGFKWGIVSLLALMAFTVYLHASAINL